MSVSRKINDGDYGSTGIDLGLSIDVPEDVESIGDFTEQVYMALHEQLLDLLKRNGLID